MESRKVVTMSQGTVVTLLILIGIRNKQMPNNFIQLRKVEKPMPPDKFSWKYELKDTHTSGVNVWVSVIHLGQHLKLLPRF